MSESTRPGAMGRLQLAVGAALAVAGMALWGCGDDHELHNHPDGSSAAAPGEGPREGTTDDGRFVARYQPTPDPIPFNEHFELTVEIEGWQPGVSLALDFVMPSHGHGMTTTPGVEHLGEGLFSVVGLLLHMTGAWELYVDLTEGGVRERIVLPFQCCAR